MMPGSDCMRFAVNSPSEPRTGQHFFDGDRPLLAIDAESYDKMSLQQLRLQRMAKDWTSWRR